MQMHAVLALLVGLSVGTSACASTKGKTGYDYFESARATVKASRAVGGPTYEDAQKAYNETLAGCRLLLQGLEKEAKLYGIARIGIAVAGAVAGLLVPVYNVHAMAHREIVAALGSFSGVANAAQSGLTEAGLTTRASLATRAEVVGNVKKDVADFTKGAKDNNPLDMMSAVNALEGDCTSYDITVNPPKL